MVLISNARMSASSSRTSRSSYGRTAGDRRATSSLHIPANGRTAHSFSPFSQTLMRHEEASALLSIPNVPYTICIWNID
jgi:hypothetical protein